MAKPFRSLWEQMSPEAQAAAEQKMQAMLAAMPLQELQHKPGQKIVYLSAEISGCVGSV
jgi:hypothetical protein